MELKEIRDRKYNVEKELCDLISDFERLTDATVERIEIVRSGLVRGWEEPPIGEVKIVVRL